MIIVFRKTDAGKDLAQQRHHAGGRDHWVLEPPHIDATHGGRLCRLCGRSVVRTALKAAKSSRIGVQIWVWRHKRRQTTRLISTSIGEGEKIALQVRCGKELPVRWPQAAWARRDKAFGLLRALNLHGQKALGGLKPVPYWASGGWNSYPYPHPRHRVRAPKRARPFVVPPVAVRLSSLI